MCMKSRRVYAGLFVCWLVCLFALWNTFSSDGDEVVITTMRLVVGETPGINTDKEFLDFGRITQLGTVERFVVLDNDGSSKRVHIVASGNLKEWVQVSDNDFVIEEGGSKDIGVLVTVPEGADMREYEGRLKFKFTKIV